MLTENPELDYQNFIENQPELEEGEVSWTLGVLIDNHNNGWATYKVHGVELFEIDGVVYLDMFEATVKAYIALPTIIEYNIINIEHVS